MGPTIRVRSAYKRGKGMERISRADFPAKIMVNGEGGKGGAGDGRPKAL